MRNIDIIDSTNFASLLNYNSYMLILEKKNLVQVIFVFYLLFAYLVGSLDAINIFIF